MATSKKPPYIVPGDPPLEIYLSGWTPEEAVVGQRPSVYEAAGASYLKGDAKISLLEADLYLRALAAVATFDPGARMWNIRPDWLAGRNTAALEAREAIAAVAGYSRGRCEREIERLSTPRNEREEALLAAYRDRIAALDREDLARAAEPAPIEPVEFYVPNPASIAAFAHGGDVFEALIGRTMRSIADGSYARARIDRQRAVAEETSRRQAEADAERAARQKAAHSARRARAPAGVIPSIEAPMLEPADDPARNFSATWRCGACGRTTYTRGPTVLLCGWERCDGPLLPIDENAMRLKGALTTAMVHRATEPETEEDNHA